MLTPNRPLSPTTATSITDGDLDLDGDIDFDLELHNFDRHVKQGNGRYSDLEEKGQKRDPRLLTFGLVVHSLADGLALGASLAPRSGSDAASDSILGGLSSLSMVVFVALALHKGQFSNIVFNYIQVLSALYTNERLYQPPHRSP